MSYCTDKLMIDGQTHTHAGNDNTRRPKLASGKNPDIPHPLRQAIGCQLSGIWNKIIVLQQHSSLFQRWTCLDSNSMNIGPFNQYIADPH